MSVRGANRGHHMLAGLLTVSALLSVTSSAGTPQPAGSPPHDSDTIGLVLTDWRFALHETPEKTECPAGLQKGEAEQFKAESDHLAQLKKFGGFQNRGRNGENANHTPMAVQDALPFSELKTTVGYGFNLDGTSDGERTARSCKHEKFTSPEGERVDNQIARVVGCVMGWRTTGFMAEFYSDEIETSPINRHLIEIAGVDDATNDESVEVALYKGRDRLVRTASGNFIPFISHRVDERFPQYVFKTHGKIVNGVLTSEPIPLVRMPLNIVQIPGERRIRDLRFRLKLTDSGAEGVLGGYEDVDTWWAMHSKGPGVGSDIGAFSPAGLYRAARRYADGYPNADTGECGAISVTYRVSAVRALIIHGAAPPVAAKRQ